MPLPFYVYSIAYGSVPIFIPQLWPHSYYNSRYGMEMLPALALFAFLAVQWIEEQMERVATAGEETDAAGCSASDRAQHGGYDVPDSARAQRGD